MNSYTEHEYKYLNILNHLLDVTEWSISRSGSFYFQGWYPRYIPNRRLDVRRSPILYLVVKTKIVRHN